MSEQRGYPIQTGILLILILGGGWYFFNHYQIQGLDGLTILDRDRTTSGSEEEWVSFRPNRSEPVLPATDSANPFQRPSTENANGSASLIARRAPRETFAPPRLTQDSDSPRSSATTRPDSIIHETYARRDRLGDDYEPTLIRPSEVVTQQYRNLRVASWAMGGFGPSKLASDLIRRNTVRVIRQFDVLAVQQVASQERDLLPRLMDALNEGQSGVSGAAHYDYILGHPNDRGVGSVTAPEQLAFIFDTTRVQADRTQTYVMSDPANRMTHDPVVAWFRAAQPRPSEAWTFTMVNIRIELSRAKEEVALLPNIMSSIRKDGRGEDDIVLAGLFQADDAYLLPMISGNRMRAAVRSLPTDVQGRHQTANLLVDESMASEYLGRGGPLNFLRAYNLTIGEAESVSPYLPVYAEFSVFEGGHL